MMYKNKRVLLMAGGGTLGTYVAKELLHHGSYVDVICPEDKVSDHPHLRFVQGFVTDELMTDLFAKTYYDGIVNFMHYRDENEYRRVHPFLIQKTDHLIFLSSYRVYANEQHPVTETAPRLHEAYPMEGLLAEDGYGVKKALCEDYLFGERKGERWTVVRPVISFSHKRLDILMNSNTDVLEKAESGEPLLLPVSVKEFGAGITRGEFAGNETAFQRTRRQNRFFRQKLGQQTVIPAFKKFNIGVRQFECLYQISTIQHNLFLQRVL